MFSHKNAKDGLPLSSPNGSNGGDISYMLDKNEVSEYIDISKVIGTIPLVGVNEADFSVMPLIGKIFIVTGSCRE